MPKKKSPAEDPAKQHERFKEAAREHGADESGETFERAFGKIVPPKSKEVWPVDEPPNWPRTKKRD